MNERESLKIISEMIEAAKSDVREDGFLYLLWGWLTFFAATAHFALLRYFPKESHWPWVILMPLGGVVTLVYILLKTRKARVKTKIMTFMGFLWTAFGMVLVLLLIFMQKLGAENTYPLIIMLYGIGTYVSGGLLSFRPLMAGGVLCWVIAGIALFTEPSYRILLLALALLVAYIIPGHMLKSPRTR